MAKEATRTRPEIVGFNPHDCVHFFLLWVARIVPVATAGAKWSSISFSTGQLVPVEATGTNKPYD